MGSDQSLMYHHGKHGNGNSVSQYAQDAQNFANNPTGKSKPMPLKDGTMGTKYSTPKGQGGIIDAKGDVVTYWYK